MTRLLLVLCATIGLLTLMGCSHDHENRTHPIVSVSPASGDVNGDGVVDENDLDALNDLLGIDPDPSCPYPAAPGDCNGDGEITYADVACIFDQLCEEHNCHFARCLRIVPRPHFNCYDDED